MRLTDTDNLICYRLDILILQKSAFEMTKSVQNTWLEFIVIFMPQNSFSPTSYRSLDAVLQRSRRRICGALA